MADASPETIQRLIGNSEKGLAQIEMSLPLLLETRQVVENAIKKHEESNIILDLTLVVLDTLLAENEVIYDLSASLDALLKAKDDYTKRYYMQSLNLCFVEAYQLFVGKKGDENGLLTKLENLTKQLNQAGCQFIAKHIIDDFQEFRKDYCDKKLRDITRHYDNPIKMYEKQQRLTSIDFFAKGASQLMAIRMEVSVLSAYLLSLLVPVKKGSQNIDLSAPRGIRELINDAVYNTINEKDLQEELQSVLNAGQRSLDECYSVYKLYQKATDLLEEKKCQIPDTLQKIESLILLRMETLYLQYDVCCSIWGYLNAASDKERSQNLRLIHISKLAALTHIYGYNEQAKEKSLWNRIVKTEEARSMKLDTNSVQKSLEELTMDLAGDSSNSRIYVHYRCKQDFYIPVRLEVFGKMQHHQELSDALKLFEVCKVLVRYTTDFLGYIDEAQKQKRKIKHDKWMSEVDGLAAMMGSDEKAKESLKPLRDLIDMFYGDKKLVTNN